MLKQGYMVTTENIQENPQCPHGPTLIFQRLVDGQPHSRKFFACSACRDRKDCNFFLWCDEKLSITAENAWKEETKKNTPVVSLKILHKEVVAAIIKNDPEDTFFCHSCTRMLAKNAVNVKHKGHKVQGNITIEQLKLPTKLLQPLQDTSKEAQFFFDDNALKCLTSIIVSLNASTIISVGTPRFAEHLKYAKCGVEVILLDLDWRYSAFYGEQFCWYNMFNHHFLGSDGDINGKLSKQSFIQFLADAKQGGSFVIVLDPPFGGRVEALAHTLRCIEQDIHQIGRTEKIYYLWIYPYFMEPYIKAELPDLQMLDYKVNYTNHPEYKQESKKYLKQGSPVRIFTNAPSELITLPSEEGYRYCSKCKKSVSKENKHCDFCNACTSKDGRTYVHCIKCQRCVKPAWRHCKKCNRCCLSSHKCNSSSASCSSNSKGTSQPSKNLRLPPQKQNKMAMKNKMTVNRRKIKTSAKSDANLSVNTKRIKSRQEKSQAKKSIVNKIKQSKIRK